MNLQFFDTCMEGGGGGGGGGGEEREEGRAGRGERGRYIHVYMCIHFIPILLLYLRASNDGLFMTTALRQIRSFS